MLLLIARYLIWRTFSTLNFADPLTTSLSLGLFAAELLGLSLQPLIFRSPQPRPAIIVNQF
jgi:hypothetical protein